MPELPEVETIKSDLQKIVLGKEIIKVCIYNPAVIREPSPSLFKKSLQGLVIKNILRRGKMLILELSNGSALAIHLKMTGQLVYPGGFKNSRVAFHLSGGRILDFNDQRLFGELRLVEDWRKIKFTFLRTNRKSINKQCSKEDHYHITENIMKYIDILIIQLMTRASEKHFFIWNY